MFYKNHSIGFLVRDVFLVNRKKEKMFYPARNFSGLSFRISGCSEITTNEKTILAETGSITYIPPETDFEIFTQSEEVIILHLDRFGAEENKITSFVSKDTGRVSDLFRQMYNEWQARRVGYENRCTALLYTLFEQLEKAENIDKSAENELIKDALLYINMHFNRGNLNIAFLSEKCNISEVYFRKIFKCIHGISPLKYINECRLEHACRLLKSGYYRIGEVAAMSGFSDTKYFSTAFKRTYGISPSEYKKEWFNV